VTRGPAGNDSPRPPRPGSPRGSGPGRRRTTAAATDRWELWNLRAFWPEAAAGDLAEFRRRRATILAREREALAGLWSGDEAILAPGHRFLAAAPDLTTGLVVSLHQGPYQLLLEVFLAAGVSPLVLASPEARDHNGGRADRLAARLGYTARIRWIDATRRADLRRFLAGVRAADQPVIAYLDGNLGRDGYAGTRDRGLPYRLPGRAIKVRTGLARIAVRLACPIHPVAVRWDPRGMPAWTRSPSLQPGPSSSVNDLTRSLYDWCFSEVMTRPAQWRLWPMLKESSACFAAAGTSAAADLAACADEIRIFRRCLERAAGIVRLSLVRETEVWPGGVLVDLDEDRFFPAAGLGDADLEILRAGCPTLAELRAHHGEAWVAFHGLRLFLLGIARLGA
jgi:hypothetical protein